jgi:hypothetical protein
MRYDGGMEYEERIARITEEADLETWYVQTALSGDSGWARNFRKLLNYADSFLRSVEVEDGVEEGTGERVLVEAMFPGVTPRLWQEAQAERVLERLHRLGYDLSPIREAENPGGMG